MGDNTIRLDKFLANHGYSSRRGIKKLLKERILTVNDKRTRESGTRVTPNSDVIKLDGEVIKSSSLVYYLLNKPKGIISTTSDEENRRNVTSFIPTNKRIYPVGRLDKDTTGLILLTNDGELTHQLTHPKYHVNKIYQLIISGIPTPEQLSAFRNGVILSDGITSPAEVTVLSESKKTSLLEVTLHEGRNRQIRRMCETLGMRLLELSRIQFGPIKIDTLQEGKYRELSEDEVSALHLAASGK